MRQCPYFDEKADNLRTREGLGLDLSLALKEGIIKDSGTEPEFNNIEDPKQIRGRANDVFKAIDERNAVMHRASAKSAPAPSETPIDHDSE